MASILAMPAETRPDLVRSSAPDPNVLTTLIAGGAHLSPLRFAPLPGMRSGQAAIYSRDLEDCSMERTALFAGPRVPRIRKQNQ
jgi:hypothetical protein